MLTSAGVPATSVANLQLNTLADGLFHAATLLLTVAGTWLLWSSARRRHVPWPAKLLLGGILLGWGLFNLVEGIVDHELLGIHHVNETVPRSQWLWWDAAFLVWGAAMAAGGWLLLRRGRAEVARRLAGLNDPQRPAGAGRAA
jgi:uncharacterized membrane protein